MANPSEELPEIQLDEVVEETAAKTAALEHTSPLDIDIDLNDRDSAIPALVPAGSEIDMSGRQAEPVLDLDMTAVSLELQSPKSPAPVSEPEPAIAKPAALNLAALIPPAKAVSTVAAPTPPAKAAASIVAAPTPPAKSSAPMPPAKIAPSATAATVAKPAAPAAPVVVAQPASKPVAPVSPGGKPSLDLDSLLSDIDLGGEASSPVAEKPELAPVLGDLSDEEVPDELSADDDDTLDTEEAPPLPVSEDEPPARPAPSVAALVANPATLDTLHKLAGAIDPERARTALNAVLKGEAYDARALPPPKAMLIGMARVLVNTGYSVNELVDAIVNAMAE